MARTPSTLSDAESVRREIWRKEDLMRYILEDLNTRLKKDLIAKKLVLVTGLSAYLEDPMNLFLKGESGVGKSTITVRTLRYFPEEDVWHLGGMSPKSLYHERGRLMNKNGKPIDLTSKPEKPKKKDFKVDGRVDEESYQFAMETYKRQMKMWDDEFQGSYYLVDLSHKVLVFLEAPDFETIRMLYPILSHDKKEITYKYTDKKTLRTTTIRLTGFPATIFLSASNRYIEELSTRGFTWTPESSKEKIEEANKLTTEVHAYPWKFKTETEETKVIKALIKWIRKKLLNRWISGVVVPFDGIEEAFPAEIVRDMRDYTHFLELLEAYVLLYIGQRPYVKRNNERYLMATREDFIQVYGLYQEIIETTRAGLQKRIIEFYYEVVLPSAQQKRMEQSLEEPEELGYTYQRDMRILYNMLHPEKQVSSSTIRDWCNRLSASGYLSIEKDEFHKQRNKYAPLVTENQRNPIKSETVGSLDVNLEKSFKKWWKKNQGNIQVYTQKKVFETGQYLLIKFDSVYSEVFREYSTDKKKPTDSKNHDKKPRFTKAVGKREFSEEFDLSPLG